MRFVLTFDTHTLPAALVATWAVYLLVQCIHCAWLVFTDRVPTDDD